MSVCRVWLLSRLAECTPAVQDKIACAQFVSALTDSFLKRTLHLEGIISLKTAIEKSIAIRIIQENSFPKGEWNNFREKVTFSREKSFRTKRGQWKREKEERNSSESKRKQTDLLNFRGGLLKKMLAVRSEGALSVEVSKRREIGLSQVRRDELDVC